MSAEALIAKIRQDAEDEIARIKDASASEVADIEADMKRRVTALETEAQLEQERQAQHAQRVALAKAKQDASIAVQTAKREALNDVFEAAQAQLVAQSPEDYVAFFVGHARAVLPEQVRVTVVRAPEQRLTETQTILSELALEAAIEPTKQTAAGLVLEADDGVYDLTLERLLSERRPDLEMTICNQLSI